VDDEAEKFAHVFAIIAQWGVGKSRIGYELVAQINDTSRGWWVRGDDGSLAKAQLFHDDRDRDQYLGLYIRYSQVANDYNNVDNWFAYGLYKALLPLTRGTFDGSIQGQIAKEAADRLFVAGFDPKSSLGLEVTANHSDEKLYEDPELATKLCQAAYDYLQTLGIKYVLVVLDELETAAEAATFGLDSTDIKHLDGRAIKLMGKAIKEEDPRRKLPWLRYVALCSPAIGDELREIQSTARRFELDGASSERVRRRERLRADPVGRRAARRVVPSGAGRGRVRHERRELRLVQRHHGQHRRAPARQAGAGREGRADRGRAVRRAGAVSGRVQQHVLDHHAIEMLRIDKAQLAALHGTCSTGSSRSRSTATAARDAHAVLAARNEYDEPIATLFRRVEWDESRRPRRCARRSSPATRACGGSAASISRWICASCCRTSAPTPSTRPRGSGRTDGKHTLIVPLRQNDFVHLVVASVSPCSSRGRRAGACGVASWVLTT
jgi:hypothetical protein